jgi:hypothetical protein
MSFNYLPVEIVNIIVNFYPLEVQQIRMINKLCHTLTKDNYNKTASVIHKKYLTNIPNPFVININNLMARYISINLNNRNYITFYADARDYRSEITDKNGKYYKGDDVEELDFLTTYKILLQRGCTPTFVKTLIIKRIKQLNLSLYSKTVSKFTYLWLYTNAAVLGFTNINNVTSTLYDKKDSLLLYHKILDHFLTI